MRGILSNVLLVFVLIMKVDSFTLVQHKFSEGVTRMYSSTILAIKKDELIEKLDSEHKAMIAGIASKCTSVRLEDIEQVFVNDVSGSSVHLQVITCEPSSQECIALEGEAGFPDICDINEEGFEECVLGNIAKLSADQSAHSQSTDETSKVGENVIAELQADALDEMTATAHRTMDIVNSPDFSQELRGILLHRIRESQRNDLIDIASSAQIEMRNLCASGFEIWVSGYRETSSGDITVANSDSTIAIISVPFHDTCRRPDDFRERILNVLEESS